VAADSKELAKASRKPVSSGLDAFIAEIEKKKKVRGHMMHVLLLCVQQVCVCSRSVAGLCAAGL
jgi:hypothetical protein